MVANRKISIARNTSAADTMMSHPARWVILVQQPLAARALTARSASPFIIGSSNPRPFIFQFGSTVRRSRKCWAASWGRVQAHGAGIDAQIRVPVLLAWLRQAARARQPGSQALSGRRDAASVEEHAGVALDLAQVEGTVRLQQGDQVSGLQASLQVGFPGNVDSVH